MFLNKIIEFSIKNKLVIGLFTIALVLYGIFELTRLPIDAVPDITNNQVQVITIAPSLGATDIERLVTFPVEQANSNIPGMHEIRSFSRFGLSLVTIVFDDGIDIYWARQQVTERLQNVKSQIPNGVGMPELGPVTTGLGEIYQYVVRAEKGYENQYSALELRTIQDWVIRRQLLSVKGVADISSFGGYLKQYEVSINPDKLQSLNVSIQDVYNAIQNNNQNVGGAYIEKGPTVLYIRSEGLVNTIEDIQNIPVKKLENGMSLLISDLAEVNIGTAVRYGAMYYNGLGEVSGAVVMMLKGGNSSDVIVQLKNRVAEIQKTLPKGVIIEPFLDRSKMVNNAIGTVEKNLIEGALIVVFVLVVFLGNFRAGILVASVIPLSMFFAIIMMNMFGVSGNLMSLGALDFGLIVDGAVIIVEAVMHSIRKPLNGMIHPTLNQSLMDDKVNKSASKMMNSAVFGQIIILIVYLPIFSLQGIEGKMFKPMAQTVAFALIGAFVLSLTYIPMMSSVFLSKKQNQKENISDKLMHKIQSVYYKSLSKALLFPKFLIVIVITLFVSSLILLSRLGGEFIPSLEEGDFAVETRVLPGSNLQVSMKASQQASRILIEKFPEVQKVVAKIGSSEVPIDPMPIDAQDLIVTLRDKSEWTSAKTFNELAEKMKNELKAVPGVTFGFQFPVQMRFNELMTGARQDVVCKIFGENLDSLASYAEKIGVITSGIEGAQDIYIEPIVGVPQIIIHYKRELLARYGLDISSVNNAVNTAFAGKSAGIVFEGEKRFELVLRLQKDKREQLSDVKNLLIPIGEGQNIPLSHLADVDIKDGPNQIQREDAKRRIVVGFNVRDRDVQTIVNELQMKIGEKLNLSSGYYITYGGAFENLNAAKKRLMIAVPIALFLILLLLYFAFGSVKQAFLIFTAIPLSAIGGIIALYARSMPFSISAGVGFIALFGVAVLNGIVLIAEFKRLKEEGITDLKELVLKGTSVRLRPVLMTAFVASLGFLPMALSNGAGAEVQRPLATVVIGGLLIATFLTLFILPIMYIISEKGFKNIFKMKKSLATLSIVFIVINNSYAQSTISLKSALDSAMKNNIGIRNSALFVKYQDAKIKSAFDLPKTNFSLNRGQINSAYTDNALTISQSFMFPKVYTKTKQIFQLESEVGQFQFKLNELFLKKSIYEVYYVLQILRQKEIILEESDSIYGEQLKLFKIRLDAGESNVIDNSAAILQRIQISIQLEEIRKEIQMELLHFNYLMNTNQMYLPELDTNVLQLPILDSVQLNKHPELGILKQELKVSEAMVALEKSKFLPDMQLAYNNMSMRGVGADNQTYNSSLRFQSFQFGVGIPIFTSALRANVRSQTINFEIAQNKLHIGELELQNKWRNTISSYQLYQKILLQYQTYGLLQAEILNNAATKQLSNGEISYIDWVVLNNHYLMTKSNYVDAKLAYNNAVIELMYLMGN